MRAMRSAAALLLFLLMGAAPVAHAQVPEVVIDPGRVAPAALQSITSAVDAITRLAEDQDDGEITRLRRRARDATLAALATQGYFSPTATLAKDNDVAGEIRDFSIRLCKRTLVESVRLKFTGRITRAEYAARVAQPRKAGLLGVGQPFLTA